MTSKPPSRRMRATTFTPRSCPSRPTLATRIRAAVIALTVGKTGRSGTTLPANVPRQLDRRGGLGMQRQREWRVTTDGLGCRHSRDDWRAACRHDTIVRRHDDHDDHDDDESTDGYDDHATTDRPAR